MTVLHWAPTRSSAVMPTVQPFRQAMPTIWSVVWMALRAPDARNGLHVGGRLEELHADGRGSQPQVLVQSGNQLTVVQICGIACDQLAHSCSP